MRDMIGLFWSAGRTRPSLDETLSRRENVEVMEF